MYLALSFKTKLTKTNFIIAFIELNRKFNVETLSISCQKKTLKVNCFLFFFQNLSNIFVIKTNNLLNLESLVKKTSIN